MQASQSEEYKRLVLDDVKSYEALAKPMKTCLLKRLITRKADPYDLHPNPEDEFSDPAIGPNYEIVARYADDIKNARIHSCEPFESPLEVTRISTGGYMLLNGHHRWYAALKMGYSPLPIHITNISSAEEIMETIRSSERSMAVAFDLDEVLLTDGHSFPRDRHLIWPLKKIFPKTLRSHAPALIRELQQHGYDVWVYTGSYRSVGTLRELFRLHGVKVDGIVNGMKKADPTLQKIYREKYKTILHIDNEAVTHVNTESKDYEILEIKADGYTWASEAMKLVKGMTDNGTE